MRRTTHRREKPQPNETGGFRFAVTLLAAFGTLTYAGYNYLQTKPIDPQRYWFVCLLTAVAGILVLGLLLYILIKGYSMEVQDSKWPGKLAKCIYIGVFSIFIMLLVHILASFLLEYVIKTENSAIEFLLLFFIPITVGTFFFLPLLRQSNNSKSKEKERQIERQIPQKGKFLVQKVIAGLHPLRKKTTVKFIIAFVIMEFTFFIALLIFVQCLFPTVLYSPLQGHVTVDMESIYYKNVSQIPVLIHVTGPNTNLSICLVKEYNNTLYHSDNITLIPEHNYSNKTVSGEQSILIGNTLDYGTYNVFINTTDLTVGYYELVCLRGRYETYGKKCFYFGKKGFYLLNSSEQSCIKE